MKDTSAYDFSQFAPQPEQEQKAARVSVHKTDGERKNALKLNRLRIRCVLLSVLLVGLVVMTVNSRTKLDETYAAIESASTQLTSYESEYAYLNYKLESLVSLKSAEEYAKNELGLVRLNGSQIEYINLQHENVIEKNEENSSVLSFIRYLADQISGLFQ